MGKYLDQLKNGRDASVIISEIEDIIDMLTPKSVGFRWGGYDVDKKEPIELEQREKGVDFWEEKESIKKEKS
jgi:hypothetical protein